MSEASRATASTWSLKSMSSFSTECNSQSNASSSVRTSSSFDINDFKPLPPTPHTIKATVKRFGNRMKGKPNPIHSANPYQDETSTKSTMGLHKSRSSWSTFRDKETDDASLRSSATSKLGGEIASIRSKSRRTLRSLIKPFSTKQVKNDDIFDERKRKAEIAYAEQFGTHKRQKQQPATLSGRHCSNADVADFMPIYSVIDTSNEATIKASTRQSNPASSTHSRPLASATAGIENRGRSSAAVTSWPNSTEARTISRSSSRTSGHCLDRVKRESRSELEKQNRKLRALLRERQTDGKIVQKDRNETESPQKGRLDSEDDTQATAAAMKRRVPCGRLNADVGKDMARETISSQTMSAISASFLASSSFEQVNQQKTRADLETRDDAARQGHAGAMKCQGACDVKPYNSSTVRKYRVSRPSTAKIEAPRALSMVLEGSEDDAGTEIYLETADASAATAATTQVRTPPGQQVYRSLDGVAEYDSTVVATVTESRARDGKSWQWPEDVF